MSSSLSSAVSPSPSPSPSSSSALDRRYLRTFSVAAIDDRCRARSHIPGYRALLMEAAVDSCEDGLIFNVKHPSWTKLVDLVQQHQRASSSTSSSAVSIAAMSPRRRRSSESSSLGFSLDEEIASSAPNLVRIRRRSSVSQINDSNRCRVWKCLLSATSSSSDDLDDELGSCQFDLYNQRVIRLDIERTRPDVGLFRNECTRARLERVLTVYCKRHLINYKQGLNYMAAPFFVVLGSSDQTINAVYTCFAAFVRRFVPNTFTDDQFGGLQCIFRMFRLLVLYHVPVLANYLDDNDMSPELYASPWFMTLFASRHDMRIVLRLWDHLLLHREPLTFYFFALAFLCDRSDALLSHNAVVLPEKLSQLTLSSTDEVDTLFASALCLLERTPASFITYFRNVTSRNVTVDSPLYHAVMQLYAMPVSAHEIVEHCFASDRDVAAFRYFVIDCRAQQHYNAGHLPLAYHLDPSLYLHPERLARRVEILSSMSGCHFCFVFGTQHAVPASDRQQFTGLQMFFIKKGFSYVSTCQGGFSACHDLVLARAGAAGGDHELIDHKPQRCIECTRRSSEPKRGFLASFRDRITGRGSDPSSSSRSPSSPSSPPPPPPAAAAFGAVPRVGVPPSVFVVPFTTEMWMLFTTLRDRNASALQFSGSADRIISSLVGHALEEIPTRESIVTCSSGSAFTGIVPEPAIVGVGVSIASQEALATALRPFNAVARCQIGYVVVEEAFERDCGTGVISSDTRGTCIGIPDGHRSGVCAVLVLIPTLTSHDKLNHVLDALSKRGFNHHSGVSISVLALIAARSTLWKCAAFHPTLSITVAAVDELSKGILHPGIPTFQTKYTTHPAATAAAPMTPPTTTTNDTTTTSHHHHHHHHRQPHTAAVNNNNNNNSKPQTRNTQ